MSTDTNHPTESATNESRYHFMQIDENDDSLAVIHDAENVDAWIQSDLTVSLER